MTEDEIERRARAATLTTSSPNTRAATERWLAELGTKMMDVWLLRSNGSWVTEKHVDDPYTIDETIGMTLRQQNVRYALRAYHGRWALHGPLVNKVRYYDIREAAEMVALHNG